MIFKLQFIIFGWQIPFLRHSQNTDFNFFGRVSLLSITLSVVMILNVKSRSHSFLRSFCPIIPVVRIILNLYRCIQITCLLIYHQNIWSSINYFSGNFKIFFLGQMNFWVKILPVITIGFETI